MHNDCHGSNGVYPRKAPVSFTAVADETKQTIQSIQCKLNKVRIFLCFWRASGSCTTARSENNLNGIRRRQDYFCLFLFFESIFLIISSYSQEQINGDDEQTNRQAGQRTATTAAQPAKHTNAGPLQLIA